MKNGPIIMSAIKLIWKIKVPPRMQIFTWIMLQNKILTANNLKKRGWQLTEICNDCTFFLVVKNMLIRKIHMPSHCKNQINSTQHLLTSREVDHQVKEALVILCFIIWRERCNHIFREELKTANEK
jgi:zinc-binding in reverse transcriptase